MGDFYQVATGNQIVVNDINQYYNALTGVMTPTTASTTVVGGGAAWRAAHFGGRFLAVPCLGPWGGAGISIVDVTNPASPTAYPVFSPATSAQPNAVVAFGRYLLCVNQGSNNATVIDVSEPSAPATVGTVAIASYVNDVVLAGRYAVAVHTGGTVEIIDLAIPSAPSIVKTVTGLGSIQAAAPFGSRYVALAVNGASAITVLSIPDGTVVGTYTNAAINAPWGIAAVGGHLAVANNGSNTVAFLSAANPAALALDGTIAVNPTGPSWVTALGRFVAVSSAGGSGEVQFIDASNPAAPTIAASASVARAQGTTALGRYLAVNQMVSSSASSNLIMLDLTGIDVAALRASSLWAGSVVADQDVTVAGRVAAQGEAIGALGLTCDGDAAFLTNLAVGGNLQSSSETVAYAATVSLTVTNADTHVFQTITGAMTINASSGGRAGQTMRLILPNDGTSGRTITFGSNFRAASTLTGTVNKAAVVSFVSDGNSWYETGRATGL